MADPNGGTPGGALPVAVVKVCPLCGNPHQPVNASLYGPISRNHLRELLQKADGFSYSAAEDLLRVHASSSDVSVALGLSMCDDGSLQSTQGMLNVVFGGSSEAAARRERVNKLTGVRGSVSRMSLRALTALDTVIGSVVPCIERWAPFKIGKEQLTELRIERVLWRYDGLTRLQIVIASLWQLAIITSPVWVGLVGLIAYLKSHFGVFFLFFLIALLGATGHAVFLDRLLKLCPWKRRSWSVVSGSVHLKLEPIPTGGNA